MVINVYACSVTSSQEPRAVSLLAQRGKHAQADMVAAWSVVASMMGQLTPVEPQRPMTGTSAEQVVRATCEQLGVVLWT